jgi:hypothetical protein
MSGNGSGGPCLMAAIDKKFGPSSFMDNCTGELDKPTTRTCQQHTGCQSGILAEPIVEFGISDAIAAKTTGNLYTLTILAKRLDSLASGTRPVP